MREHNHSGRVQNTFWCAERQMEREMEVSLFGSDKFVSRLYYFSFILLSFSLHGTVENYEGKKKVT